MTPQTPFHASILSRLRHSLDLDLSEWWSGFFFNPFPHFYLDFQNSRERTVSTTVFLVPAELRPGRGVGGGW